MFDSIFNVLYNLISSLSDNTVGIIDGVIYGISDVYLMDHTINFTLFSETPIFTMDLYDLLLTFFVIFYTMFFIVLLYKVSKKVIKSIFGVLKWW